MRTKSLLGVLLAVLCLAACAPSEATISTAIAQTQAAHPTRTPAPIPTTTIGPTATTIPLASLNLEPFLLMDGDLPPSFVGGQIRSEPPEPLAGWPAAAQVINRSMRTGDFASDGVTIALYEDSGDLDAAYQVAADWAGGTALTGIGDRGQISGSSTDLLNSRSARLVFAQCTAIVVLQLYAPEASSDVTKTYVQRLARRLEPVLCR